MFTRNYLIIYDICNDKTRRKVTKILESYGVRVQYSSFECGLNPSSKKQLKSQLSKLADKDDSIRIYRMTEETEIINKENQKNISKKASIIF